MLPIFTEDKEKVENVNINNQISPHVHMLLLDQAKLTENPIWNACAFPVSPPLPATGAEGLCCGIMVIDDKQNCESVSVSL